MALSIKTQRADRLARELVALTGESITQAVEASLEVRLDIERLKRRSVKLSDIVERFQRLPVLDARDSDAILGYDSSGLPE